MPEREDTAARLLEAARRRSPEQRTAFLEGVAALDAALAGEVRSLLQTPEGRLRPEPPSGSDPALVDPTITSMPAGDEGTAADREIQGRRIGPYRLQRQVGRGGSGAVYLAERDDDEFRKTVAIKILHPGMETADIVIRFRQERQILATLDHPFIAKLHDGGTTDDGLPYFVMEYVAGQPIDRYCDAHRLSVRERLELFRRVCAAVHFAHQNLVVHRDLKPGNILVTADGTPMLLDFGIAKLLGPEPAKGAIAVTLADSRPMTPEYASPEQVRGQPITTASDVYSLGVVLYELLTGHRPLRIRSPHLYEMVRIISEEEPPRPSDAVFLREELTAPLGKTAQAVTPESVGQARGEDAESLRRRIGGDLDNIVLMAMSKEAARRYASAAALAEDIRRHLESLPVAAREDTLLYRTTRFVRRHRTGVAVAAAFVLALVAFGVTMTLQSARIALQRNRAEQEAAKAKAINEFLQKTLGAANPNEGMGRGVTVLEALKGAAATIEDSFPNEPATRAAVKNTIGFTYLRLGRYDDAEPLLRSALALRKSSLGEDHPDVAESLTSLGGLMLYRGAYEEGEALFRQALALQRPRLGRHPEVAASLNNLALCLTYRGDYAAAEPMYREALALRRELLGPEHATVAETLNNLAFLLHDKGDYEGAERIYREVVELDRRLLGPEHPSLAIDLDNFASLLDDKGDYAVAEPLFREALAIRRKALGETHPDVAKSLNNLASLLERKGDHAAAEPLYREAIALRRQLFVGAHPDLATNLNNLARLLTTRGAREEALRLFHESQQMYRTTLGEDHWLLASSRTNLGRCLLEMRRYPEAERELLRALEVLEEKLGASHERTRIALEVLVRLYDAWGRPVRAAEFRARLAPTPSRPD